MNYRVWSTVSRRALILAQNHASIHVATDHAATLRACYRDTPYTPGQIHQDEHVDVNRGKSKFHDVLFAEMQCSSGHVWVPINKPGALWSRVSRWQTSIGPVCKSSVRDGLTIYRVSVGHWRLHVVIYTVGYQEGGFLRVKHTTGY